MKTGWTCHLLHQVLDELVQYSSAAGDVFASQLHECMSENRMLWQLTMSYTLCFRANMGMFWFENDILFSFLTI